MEEKMVSVANGRFEVQTLEVGEGDDVVFLQYADDFGRLIKSSTVEIINEAGRLPQLEQTEATQEKVLARLG